MEIWQYLEILGAIVGLVYIYLEYKADNLLWIVGVIMPAIYIYVCFQTGLYADLAINAYYLLAAIYGWFVWKVLPQKEQKELPITIAPRRVWGRVVLLSFVLSILIVWLLIRFTDSSVPYMDGITTALSVVGMWMLIRKYAEQWIVWFVVDVLSCGLYLHKELYFTSVLYAVYAIISIFGYIRWLRVARSGGV